MATRAVRGLGSRLAELFSVPAGNWEYNAALNDSWAENYGLHAALGRIDHPTQPRRELDGQVLPRGAWA